MRSRDKDNYDVIFHYKIDHRVSKDNNYPHEIQTMESFTLLNEKDNFERIYSYRTCPIWVKNIVDYYANKWDIDLNFL